LEDEIILRPEFFRLTLETCFREKISDVLLEMLLDRFVRCTPPCRHSYIERRDVDTTLANRWIRTTRPLAMGIPEIQAMPGPGLLKWAAARHV
jgi:hypothetical protein